MEKLTELQCIYDTRQSFYRKAYYGNVETLHGVGLGLYSYNTLVCIIYNNYYILNEYSFYSQTTTRHVKEFLKQFLGNTIVKQFLEHNNYSKKIIIKYNRYQARYV